MPIGPAGVTIDASRAPADPARAQPLAPLIGVRPMQREQQPGQHDPESDHVDPWTFAHRTNSGISQSTACRLRRSEAVEDQQQHRQAEPAEGLGSNRHVWGKDQGNHDERECECEHADASPREEEGKDSEDRHRQQAEQDERSGNADKLDQAEHDQLGKPLVERPRQPFHVKENGSVVGMRPDSAISCPTETCQ